MGERASEIAGNAMSDEDPMRVAPCQSDELNSSGLKTSWRRHAQKATDGTRICCNCERRKLDGTGQERRGEMKSGSDSLIGKEQQVCN